jgi:hypothetical protein
LDEKKCIGQGYDGASSMSGKFNVCQKKFQEFATRALYTHCRSHCLALSIGKSCREIPAVRNMFGTLSQVISFFGDSAQRKAKLRSACDNEMFTFEMEDINADDIVIQQLEGGKKCKGVPKLNPTRWSSRNNSVSAFLVKLPTIVASLEDVEDETTDQTISSKAMNLRLAVVDFQFIITLTIVQYILGFMHGLTTYLQQINIDFSSASTQAKTLLSTLEEQRNEHVFSTVYEGGVHTARTVGTSPSTPRLTSKQKHRANCATSSVEDYYRINIYYPFIDHCITELRAAY